MDNLLTAVLDAHGGLPNWAKATMITAQMSLSGPFWGARGWPDVYSKQTVTIDPHREHITFKDDHGINRNDSALPIENRHMCVERGENCPIECLAGEPRIYMSRIVSPLVAFS